MRINENVLIIGFPKTGTSTLSRMLTILGYNVTGPNQGDSKIEHFLPHFNAFQDFPWFMKLDDFLKLNQKLKVIVLERDIENWWLSFYISYGIGENNYLLKDNICLGLKKTENNKAKFIEVYKNYYRDSVDTLKRNEIDFLYLKTDNIQYHEICKYLNKKIPRNIFFKPLSPPRVNVNNMTRQRNKWYVKYKYFRKLFVMIFGVSILQKLSRFYHRKKSKIIY